MQSASPSKAWVSRNRRADIHSSRPYPPHKARKNLERSPGTKGASADSGPHRRSYVSNDEQIYDSRHHQTMACSVSLCGYGGHGSGVAPRANREDDSRD